MQGIQLFDQTLLFKQCRQLIDSGKKDQAFAELVRAIRSEKLDPAGLARAGRLMEKIDSQSIKNISAININVAIIGQCTTSYLSPLLKAFAASENIFLTIQDESYDSVIQNLMQLDKHTDVVILLPWNQRLLANNKSSHEQRIAEELNFWQQSWQLIKQNSHARVIQISYDWCSAGPQGQFKSGQSEGGVCLIRQINQQLREQLTPSAYFVDLDVISGQIGRQQFYDARSYYWTKQPFSETGLALLAKHVWAGMRALITGPKKVLVLDLDNTLWGGILGEVGSLGVELGENPTGEAYKDFQRTVKSFSDIGVILAVCSKNNEHEVLDLFQKNKNMILQLQDFAALKAGWGTKSEAIQKIAAELNVGLNSVVFFDDSAFEREQVRSALPEVTVVNVPEDPAYYCQALLDGLWFDSLIRTQEDSQRTQHYQQQQLRNQSSASFSTIDQYLESLAMEAKINGVDDGNIERVVQLLGKTNQFNLTTRRHSQEAVSELLSRQHAVGICLNLKDRFGDYGLVSVLLAYGGDTSSNDLIIDSWLMSCRTISRSVEQYLYNFLVDHAKKGGFLRIIGEYIPTAKNELVKNLYEDLGFSLMSDDIGGADVIKKYALSVAQASNAVSYIKPQITDD